MFTSLSNESFSGHSLEYIKKVKEFYEDQVSILNGRANYIYRLF